jgi:DNA-binding MarR family transcriptional regulator
MASLPNDSIKNIRELGLFYRADTKRFWWIEIVEYIGVHYSTVSRAIKKVEDEDEK